MTPFVAYTADDFRAGAQALLRRGRAWPRRLTSLLAAFCAGIGDAWFQFHTACVTFLQVESDPAQAVQLLPDWEADFGLPDGCSATTPTLDQRHAALLSKIAAQGGQTAAYFIGVAAALGYDITVTTWTAFTTWSSPRDPVTTAAWRFVWQVNAPSVTVLYFTGWSSPWDPLFTISDTELACRLQKIAPGYGLLLFNYG